MLMQEAYSELEELVGYEKVNKLAKARIAIFGIGGVGSYVVEALARCGVGSMTLVDYGEITETDLNRHLFATASTLGKSKVQLAKNRIRDIDDDILVHTYETYYGEETAQLFDFHDFDYIVDTLGPINSKLLLIEHAKDKKVPIISCMGTVNKFNPVRFEIADIAHTSVCPVAKAIRTQLRKKGIHKVKVLYSRERSYNKEGTLSGTVSFVYGAAGSMVAGEVIQDLLAERKRYGKRQIQKAGQMGR